MRAGASPARFLPKGGQQIAASAEDLRSFGNPKLERSVLRMVSQPCRAACAVRHLDGLDQE
jgi:hypothetical protein